MFISNAVRSALATAAVAAALWVAPVLASAQTPGAIPTAPGADRTLGTAPATAAKASLPGDNGSPLEPYLFTFILIGGGIIAALGVRFADAKIRADESRFQADGSRGIFGITPIR